MSTTTTATSLAATRSARIDELQREITTLLNNAGERWHRLECELAREGDALRREIRLDRSGTLAIKVAEAFARDRVDTGPLCSRLVDELEARGQKAYPPPYAVERSRWDLVERR